MIAAGCDVGSLTAKAVLMNNGDIIAAEVVRAKGGPEESARMVMDAALAKAGLSMEDIGLCVGTGYGRKQIPFVDAVESEIVCHGKGAVWQAPDVRTIVDIGGQDCKAIRIDDTGNVARYVYNDRCASGTGRFLEIIAEALEIGLEEMGDIDARAENHLTLSHQCVVFAETEIISLVNQGVAIPDIVAALHRAVAGRAASLARGIGVEQRVAMSGGVAKNEGMFRALAAALGVELVRLNNPQITGALGAALIAAERIDG